MDNASVHRGGDIQGILDDIENHFGIKLIFLPAYSPELNPCELVFAWLKNYLRQDGSSKQKLVIRLFLAIGEFTNNQLMNFYLKCIVPRNILPDIDQDCNTDDVL